MFLKVRGWLKRESGVSEAATAIWVLPIIAALIFLLVEAGFNMRTRTALDNIVQDTVRSAALEGGYNNPRSSSLSSAYSAGGWAQLGTERLRASCADGNIRTTMSCGSLSVACDKAVVNNTGDSITCWLNPPVTYKTVSTLSTNPAFSFGMAGLFDTPISVSITSKSAIGRLG